LQANGNGASDAAFTLPRLRGDQKVRQAEHPPSAICSPETADPSGTPA
jgi:hypothetical protein